MAKEQTLVLRGKVDWCKLTGSARPHTGLPRYDKGPAWSVDFTPDAKSRALIKAAGIEEKLRSAKGEKDKRTETFLTLKHLENTKIGKPDNKKNKPPVIIDGSGRPWGDDDIGNGSVVDLMVKVKHYEDTIGVYYQKMRVLDHVEYEGGTDFEPLSEDDEFFAKGDDNRPDTTGETGNPDDLEDDIPF